MPVDIIENWFTLSGESTTLARSVGEKVPSESNFTTSLLAIITVR
jgi:hypothetical protein